MYENIKALCSKASGISQVCGEGVEELRLLTSVGKVWRNYVFNIRGTPGGWDRYQKDCVQKVGGTCIETCVKRRQGSHK
jgi:hypothetical protein